MSLIILNGSPKGDSNSNTDILIKQFTKNLKQPYEIKLIAKEPLPRLCEQINLFDTVICVMPLYIHAMPGIVLKLFEQISPAAEGKSMGFIVQAGFVETEQQKYLVRYFEQLTARLNYKHLGTVQKGDAAGIYVMPGFMNHKLFIRLNELGRVFEETGMFDNSISEGLQKPYSLSKAQVKSYQFAYKVGLNSLPWSIMQIKNHAYRKRLEKPFL